MDYVQGEGYYLRGNLALWRKGMAKLLGPGVHATNIPFQISIASSTKKNVPIYNLTITVTDKNSKSNVYKVSKPFSEWFDQTGQFVAVPFQAMLANAVPVIGKRDPKRVTVSKELLDASPDVLDAILAANATGAEAEVADATGKKAAKRRNA
jgi:hypothetical protein